MSAQSSSQTEKTHLAALRRFEKHDHSLEPGLDHITALVAWFFNAPISVIGLLLEDESVVLSFYGLESRPTQHRPEWCKAAIASDDIFCIPNALEDSRVKSDPFVVGDFGLRFFAAAPLRARDGQGFGTLCVVDRKPRKLTVAEKEFLKRMALLTVDLIESRLQIHQPPALLKSAGPFSIRFNRSIIGKPEAQQIEWLAGHVIGNSSAIQKVRELLRLAIEKQADSVLLLGETGTGKGVCAHAIHEGSGARGHFIEVNCAALPHDLIESELFGHEKGSFTGATGRKIGLFEQADGGTLFLDEIAELPQDLQVKLLTVLQGRELRRVGGDRAIPINVRIVAATNRPLEVALNDGSFRRDLFFRIGSWRIELPLLRRRDDDVIALARHFTSQLVREKDLPIAGISPDAEILLKQYDWPGNVRQLLNVVAHAIILESGSVISREVIQRTLEEEKNLFDSQDPSVESFPLPTSHIERKRVSITESEALSITEALARNRNIKSKTAKELGLTRTQLEYRLKLIEQMNEG